MKQKQPKEKEQKSSPAKIVHNSYSKNYEILSKDDKKHYKSDNVSVEIIEYKL